jgi:uncharacterized OB-fold protein
MTTSGQATALVSADPARFEVHGAAGATLIGTSCTRCETTAFGAQRACLACASNDVERVAVDGHGTVLTYSIIHRPAKDWWGSTPYVVAEVETDDHVVVVAAMVDISPEEVVVGARVELRCVLVDGPTPDVSVAVYQWAPPVAVVA